jgi:Predicted permease, DMT superfamily
MLTILVFTKKLSFKFTQKKLLLFLGIANGAAYLLQYIGIDHSTAAKASLFINISSLWVAIISPRVLGEKWSSRKMAGVTLGALGVVIVTTNLNFALFNQDQYIGDLILLVAGIIWALFLTYNKKLETGNTEALVSTTWILLITLIPLLPFAAISGTNMLTLPWIAWAAILYTAIACWIIPYYLWLEGLKYLSASTSTILLLSQIILSIALSAFLLQEILTVFFFLGAIAMVGAIVFVSTQPE